MDEVPDCRGLYIGGLDAVDQPDRVDDSGITHILTILEFDYCDYEEFARYEHLWIQAEDHPDEYLARHFNATNSFIEHGLDG